MGRRRYPRGFAAGSRYVEHDPGARSHPGLRVSEALRCEPNLFGNQRPETEGAAAMSIVRVHNFSISLDGFGTGEPQSHEAPFGHAGERLHGWMFTTRWWRGMVGEP